MTSEARSVGTAMFRGVQRRCPNCGIGASMRGYLKVRETCASCGEALGHLRADDFPPYLTIVLVGHLIVPLMLWVEQRYAPAMGVQLLVWPLLTLGLTLLALPYVKGSVVGLMWALRLRP
jgi:uncharacterized protein (DUF983 family)